VVRFFYPSEVCGDHFHMRPFFSFWCLPVSLIESTYHEKVLAALKEVEFRFSPFSKSDNIDQVP
jgi:hypothetical protein